MKALKAYVEARNSWARIFGNPEINLKSAADRQRLAASIDADLSPENLTCDGELSRSQVQARYSNLITVARELKAFDPNVTFQEV
jgi:hypothetical protein